MAESSDKNLQMSLSTTSQQAAQFNSIIAYEMQITSSVAGTKTFKQGSIKWQ